MKGTMELDEPMRQALIEDGLMRPGALPKVTTATAAGGKALLDAIEKARQSWRSLVRWEPHIYFSNVKILTVDGLSKV